MHDASVAVQFRSSLLTAVHRFQSCCSVYVLCLCV